MKSLLIVLAFALTQIVSAQASSSFQLKPESKIFPKYSSRAATTVIVQHAFYPDWANDSTLDAAGVGKNDRKILRIQAVYSSFDDNYIIQTKQSSLFDDLYRIMGLGVAQMNTLNFSCTTVPALQYVGKNSAGKSQYAIIVDLDSNCSIAGFSMHTWNPSSSF